jgi:hypothetical protein
MGIPRFTFDAVDTDGGKLTMTFEAYTWMEAAERFLTFLKGTGYYLSGEDLGNHYITEHGGRKSD